MNQWHLQGRLGLHGTSNIFKYREPHREVVVGKVVLWRQLENAPVQAIGIGGDHRFGHFRWLPRLWGTVNRRTLPSSGSAPGTLLARTRRRWQFRAERLGDKWGALDAERDFRSAIYLEEWQLVLSRRFPVFNRGGF